MAPYKLFCMGNPLLDMQVRNGEELLVKYNLKANDAILAGAEHAPLFDELLTKHKLTFVAGGAAQNAARGAAYVLPPNSVAYTGCVGDDELAAQLREANKKEDVYSAYQVQKGEKTGACAVVLTGHHRSLVTTLAAAEKFEPSHLETPEVKDIINSAQFYYLGGFFLTHGVESALELAKHASNSSKVFAMNLSAPFIAQFFKVQLNQILPYVDILIGNNDEASAWASATGLDDTSDVPAITKALATQPKANASRPRIVVITRGAESTFVVTSDKPDSVQEFQTTALADSEIVDTNGAGDAFAGAFMGAYVLGKSIPECVAAGSKLGTLCVKQIGPQYPYPKAQIL
ncbi:adenosine kinase [Auriculariales sp. MPI-PUGE-AT-0066]|nr:adenosine kinase [Auriculariales sp. MPI-PUGE-AT-0066]